MTRTLLGIHGKAGSGKDTLCALLQNYRPFTRMAFADPLKRACVPLFGLPEHLIFRDDYKAQTHPYWQMQIRTIYQLLGTEAMRGTFGDEFWIRRWEMEYMSTDADVIVTDVRFENEASRIRGYGGMVVHIERPTRASLDGAAETHASEAGVKRLPCDYVIVNDGTLKDLESAAVSLLVGIAR